MDNNIGKKLDGRYELLELIGVGGMADIYKAKDITEDKIVAVKILKNEFAGSEDFLRRFRNESKAIALLSHPNIVKIFDVGFNEKIQFIVMEFIDGITLTEYIERQGVLKWKDAIHFTTQILKALQHAHDRGIVHRDIKSQNVMLLADGTIKVMDFGIARFNRETDKTMSEKAIGSVHYISPEQARGEITDEKSDIYSVGVMLYEMLTGQKPFDGDSPVSIALMHMQTQPKKPTEINSTIPEGLEEITMKAMQKEPSKRYQTAGEMINDIEEFKKNPSIVFEYKYFSTDGTTKYFDKVGNPAEAEDAAKAEQTAVEEVEESDEYEDDEDEEEIEERRSPLLPILFAVASVFVIMTAWLVFTIVTGSIPTGSGNADEMAMPNLLGMTWEDALAQYPELDLQPKQDYSTEYAKNVIMEQDTVAGRTIKKTATINVTVSNGPKEIELQDYTKFSLTDTVAQLEKQGLKTKTVRQEDDEIAESYVIKTSPAARSIVNEGDTITIYVSMGASETNVVVPDFKNLTLEAAEELAKDNFLILTSVTGASEMEKGKIFEQSVEPKSSVPKDSVIEVTISNGESPIVEDTITVEFPTKIGSTGEFTFQYYQDGVELSDKKETRDMSVNSGKQMTWDVSGTGKINFSIKITSKETGKSGLLLDVDIDFSKDTPKQTTNTYNSALFKSLSTPDITEAPVTDPPATEPPVTTTTTPVTTTTPKPVESKPETTPVTSEEEPVSNENMD